MNKFEEIIKYGKFYFPANYHYMNNSKVICDRCYKSDIASSIGYGQLDLCLQCAEIVANQMKNKQDIISTTDTEDSGSHLTFMEQSIFRPMSTTNMEQNIFRNNAELTKMMQNIYNTKKKMAQGMFRNRK